MTRRELWCSAVLLFVTSLLTAAPAVADSYPNKPITIVVCFPAGGGADVSTRMIAKYASKILGQNIAIINVTGGNGAIGYLQAAGSSPDGYTLVNLQSDILTLDIQKLAPVDKDTFLPIIEFAIQPAALITRSDAPWKTFDEFVKAMKANPGKHNVGGSPLRGFFDQASVLLTTKTGIRYNYVPTGGAPETVNALVGGQVDTALTYASTAKGQIKAGNLRALAIFSDQRIADMPDVPTLKDLGVDVTYTAFYGIGAVKGTPPEVLHTLEEAFTKAFNSPDLKADLKRVGLEPSYLNSKDFRRFLDEDVDKVRGVMSQMDKRK